MHGEDFLLQTLGLGDQVLEKDDASGVLDSGGSKKYTPLYMRVLSALIMEDATEECEEHSIGRNMSFAYSREGGMDVLVDTEFVKNDIVHSQYGPVLGLQVQNQKQLSVDRSCNGSITVHRGRYVKNQLYNVDFPNRWSMHSAARVFSEYPENGDTGPPSIHANASSIPFIDYQYEQMSPGAKLMRELQSVGIHLEAMVRLKG